MSNPENDPVAEEPVAQNVEAALPLEIVSQSLREYFRGWITRIRRGDSGLLPVIAAMLVITLVFQAISPRHVFLSAGNLVNLFQQSAVFMVLAMGETFALLLGEIDLSVGWVAFIGGITVVQLVQPRTVAWPWWAAILGALLICAFIGFVMGTLITRLKLPSFLVSLAFAFVLQGAGLIELSLGPFSGYLNLDDPSKLHPSLGAIYKLMWGNIDPVLSWVLMAVAVGLLGLSIWLRDSRRRRSGLVAPPTGLTLLKIGALAAAGAVVVFICDINRANLGTLEGVPWFIPIVLSVLAVWTILLQRTRYGRAVYAVGGNPEAARRAGISLATVRTVAFVLCSMTAGIAGLLYASSQGGMSNNFAGGSLVLYAVGAAVIGGTSLFGGRGKVINGVLGGLVIGGIYNGMFLLSLDASWQYVVTGAVLIGSVTIDAISRRGAMTGSVVHV
jgi:D-xylose transport system permease protein